MAAVTELVASSTVDDIKTNQKELVKGEETNSVQIVMLEKEINVMLGNLRNQSDRMKTMYSDKRELQERLAELTRDETDLIRTVSHLTEALEVAFDVAIEFQSFMFGLEMIPLHLDMLEKGVRSVLTQQLEVDMLPYMPELGTRNVDDAKSLRLVRAVMQISRAGSAVKYMLPELYEPFELVQIRVLQFSLTDNGQMVRFKLESELVAMNSVGESFLFPVGICTREQDLRICDIRVIEFHKTALMCAESLLSDSDDIPDICKKTAVIVTPPRQEYVYHELENRVTVFSHVKENFQ